MRTSFEDGGGLRYDVLPRFAALAAQAKFTIPVARAFPLDEWRTAMQVSLAGHAHGKLLVLTS